VKARIAVQTVASAIRLAAILMLALAWSAPARAQFSDQVTWGGTAGGSANAQTVTINTASTYADLLGVVIKYTASATNTGAATLNVNSFGTSPAINKLTGAGLVALTGGEIASGNAVLLMYNGTVFVLVSPASDIIGARMLGSSSQGMNAPINLQLTAAASGGALTVNVVTAAGATPSPSTPIPVVFGDSTVTGGDPVLVSQQAALTFTISSGSTMGCTSAATCRLWVAAINNGGTLALCAINLLSGTTLAALSETALWTSGSGTGGGNSAQTLYCGTSAVTSKTIRILGYVEATETGGSWASPTVIRLFGPGVPRPGTVLQRKYAVAASLAITLSSVCNVVGFSAGESLLVSSGTGAGVTLVRTLGSTVVATKVLNNNGGGATEFDINFVFGLDAPGTTSAQTYTITNSAGTPADQAVYLEEIMGALPEPANDDGGPLRMVG